MGKFENNNSSNFLNLSVNTVLDKLKELKIILPQPPNAVGAYLPALKVNDLVYTSGVLPFGVGGVIDFTQQIDSSTIEEGQGAAMCAFRNALSILREYLGELDNIKRIVRVCAYINSQPGFCQQSLIINPVSEALISIWGENGKHVRTAIGVNELPLGSSVELEMIVQVK